MEGSKSVGFQLASYMVNFLIVLYSHTYTYTIMRGSTVIVQNLNSMYSQLATYVHAGQELCSNIQLMTYSTNS